MADLISRPLEKSDYPFCWSLYEESTKPAIAPFIQRNWASADEEERFRSIWTTDNAQLIVCDGKPVGWYGLKQASQTVVVEHFYVTPSHRQRRIGSILMRYIVDTAKSQGKRVTLEVINGSSARVFYEKLGFTEVSRKPVTTELAQSN